MLTSGVEGSHSGLVRPPAKRVGGDELPRGFESRSLRHHRKKAPVVMGTFSVNMRIIGTNGVTEDIDALVDTGATYASLPASLLQRLGIAPIETGRFRTATGEVVEMHLGQVEVELDGRRRVVLTVFGPDGAGALLGATVLELFSLAVDPIEQRLTPVPGLLM